MIPHAANADKLFLNWTILDLAIPRVLFADRFTELTWNELDHSSGMACALLHMNGRVLCTDTLKDLLVRFKTVECIAAQGI